MFLWLNKLFNRRAYQPRYRYPFLAEANKALFALEEEVSDFQLINEQMEKYREAQELPEKDRDLAFIPIYLSIEQFVLQNKPPITKHVWSKQQLRDKVRSKINPAQMGERFRLIFMPENQQIDHILKQGILPLLNFLLTSLGRNQLEIVLKESTGATPLGAVTVSDDGILFSAAHQQFQLLPLEQVLSAYRHLYRGVFNEIKKLFGEPVALEQVKLAGEKINHTYDQELYSIYLAALPDSAKTDR